MRVKLHTSAVGAKNFIINFEKKGNYLFEIMPRLKLSEKLFQFFIHHILNVIQPFSNCQLEASIEIASFLFPAITALTSIAPRLLKHIYLLVSLLSGRFTRLTGYFVSETRAT